MELRTLQLLVALPMLQELDGIPAHQNSSGQKERLPLRQGLQVYFPAQHNLEAKQARVYSWATDTEIIVQTEVGFLGVLSFAVGQPAGLHAYAAGCRPH